MSAEHKKITPYNPPKHKDSCINKFPQHTQTKHRRMDSLSPDARRSLRSEEDATNTITPQSCEHCAWSRSRELSNGENRESLRCTVASHVFWDTGTVSYRSHSGEHASSEQKLSEQTRPNSDIVPKSFLSAAKCIRAHPSFPLARQWAASSELASSEQRVGEQRATHRIILRVIW